MKQGPNGTKAEQSLFSRIVNTIFSIFSWFFPQAEQREGFTTDELAQIQTWIVQNRFPGVSLLHEAAKVERTDVIRWLLENGNQYEKDMNARDNYGWTPLHRAAQSGHTATVQFLLTLPVGQCPDVNAATSEGSTPLHLAAGNGHTKTVQFLLKLPKGRRPDVNARTTIGLTLLHYAAENGSTKIVRLLLNLPKDQRPDVNARGPNGLTPLHYAAQQGCTETVQFLLSLPEGQRSDVNAKTTTGWTPLHCAANKGFTETVRFLLKVPKGQRPDVNARSKDGWTPLHLAAQNGFTEIVRFLLKLPKGQRPDVNARDNFYRRTSLHLAARHGRTAIIQSLLNLPVGRRPHVDARDATGRTPLHWASGADCIATVEFLLNLPEGQRSNINAATNDGKTPIEVAFEQGHHHIVQFLQRHGAELPEHLRAEVAPGAAAINDRQSTHTTSVHESVSKSTTALLARYAKEDINAAQEELFAWVRAQAGDTTKLTDNIEAAKRCINRLGAAEFTDPRSAIPLSQAFGLIWLGVNDVNAVAGMTLTAEDIQTRRQTLIEHLYRMQRGYNLDATGKDNGLADNPSCTSGSFNTLITTLAGGHQDVTFIFVNTNSVQLKAESILKECIKTLTQEEKKVYAKEDWVEGEILPKNGLEKLKAKIQANLEKEFKESKHTLHNYDEVVKQFLDSLEYHPQIDELAKELGKLREVKDTTSSTEIELSSTPGYFPSAEKGNETAVSAPLLERASEAPNAVARPAR